MSKKLTGHALAEFEAGRDIWQEVLDGVREIKAGGGRRFVVEPGSPIVHARLKSGPYPGTIRCVAGSLETHTGTVGTRPP